MVLGGCPPTTSLGITRSFPRLYPILGLVTVALLTLAPLALRPVRLACLIHAANVHSEPGSNPSKKVDRRRPRPAGQSQLDRSSIHGVEESDWSHRDGRQDQPRPIRFATALPVGVPSLPECPNQETNRHPRPTPASLKGPHSTTEPRSTELSKKEPAYRRHRPERLCLPLQGGQPHRP